MKIKSIEFSNHPILKNLSFSFEIENVIKDFTLLIGENGGGKTVLLEEIYKIIHGGITLWNDGVDRKIIMEFSDQEKGTLNVLTNSIVFDYKESYSSANGWQRIKVFDFNGADITSQMLPMIQGEGLKQLFKCAYSTVEINFTTDAIESVKATSIDNEEIPKSKSSSNISKEISQLLVDIKAQDDAEHAKWMKENVGKNVEVPNITGKLDRFRKAYSRMFESKEMVDIRAESGNQKIFFRDTKNKIEFDISGLSSGEKQIVYRVGYLLRNLGTLSGGVILIDEPELSLHPVWQMKFIAFLRELFTNEETHQLDIQFIIATHSPYLLKSSLDPDVGVTMLSRNSSGDIESEGPQIDTWSLFENGPTIGEINYYAYKLPTLEFHNELYGALHEKFISSAPAVNEAKRRSYISIFDLEVLAMNDQIKQVKNWSELREGIQQSAYPVTLSTFIRNKIHHPESTQTDVYTSADFQDSIKHMISLLKS